MEELSAAFRCKCCLEDFSEIKSVKDEFKQKLNANGEDMRTSRRGVSVGGRKGNLDTYIGCMRRKSWDQNENENFHKENNDFYEYEQNQNQSTMLKRTPLVNDVNLKTSRFTLDQTDKVKVTENELPLLTSEEKAELFRILMSPWMKSNPNCQWSIDRKTKKRKKDQLSFIEKKYIAVQKTRRSIDIKNLSSKDMNSFLATATAETLQKYYRSIPARIDSKPVNFPTNTFLRQSKLKEDLNRINELRKQNLTLCFRINQIQRTQGVVDHINPVIRRSSKRENILKRIEKIERDNADIYKNLQNAKGKLPTRLQLEEDWKKKIKVIRDKSKYPLAIPGLVSLERIKDDEEFRPRVFLEFGIQNGNVLGRIILSLYLELMPQTVINFVALCENFQQNLNEDRRCHEVFRHLAGSSIHRIFPNLYFEGGDIITGHGSTGKAAHDADFYPDSMSVPHDYDGIISMTMTQEGQVNSLFAISFRPLEILKGRRPAFGRVVKGFKLLKIIESYGTKNGKPKQTILITRCGLIYPKK